MEGVRELCNRGVEILWVFLDEHPVAFLALLALMLAIILRPRQRKTEAKTSRAKGMLNQILFWWTRRDPFRVRDLLAGGVLILGRSGSGKTSSSGRLLMRALADNPDSGGLILAAKPEDEEDVRRIFRRRENDLLVFDIDNLLRFNFLQYVGNWPARNVVQCLMTMGETLKRGEGKGKDEAPFWDALNERSLFNTVVPLKAAGEPISPERMLKFLMSAPTSPEEQRSDQWRALYHNKVMERASARPKSPIEVLDFQLAMEFWVKEYPSMDPKTRANGLAGVMNILHSFNQGIVREMCAGKTNCSPDDILNGKWVLVNFPVSVWGEVGSLICTGWKYLTQLAVLRRKATEDSPFVTIWADEAHLNTTSFDSTYIAMCRSHKGCLVNLTQSVSSFYATMKGENGRSQADALLANFSHWVVHACDPVTAKACVAKLGRERKLMFGGSKHPQPDHGIYDELMGQSSCCWSFNEHMESVLDESHFMVGRTGGTDNDFLCDATVIKSGEPFTDGRSFKRLAFSQKG